MQVGPVFTDPVSAVSIIHRSGDPLTLLYSYFVSLKTFLLGEGAGENPIINIEFLLSTVSGIHEETKNLSLDT